MKIATFNLWGAYGPLERRPVLVRAVAELDADLLCLQEAVDPDLLNQWGYPVRLRAPAGNLAILSRFPVRTHRTVTYAAASPVESYVRQALLAELQIGARPVWVVTTHLSWRENDEPTRLLQAQELIRLTEPLRGDIFVTGDLNAEPTSAPVRAILQAGFTDLFARRNPGENGWTWDNRNPFIQSHSVQFPDRRIDYLLLREETQGRMRVEHCEVVCRTPNAEGLFPSDHYGVRAFLQME